MLTYSRFWKQAFMAIFLVVAFSGCDSMQEEAPTVIPSEAFNMEMDAFDGSEEAAKAAAGGELFWDAKLSVVLVSAVLHGHLIIPKVLTAAALEAEPTIEDGTWTWTSTKMIGGSGDQQGFEISFTLTATPHADGEESGIDWSMTVSKTDAQDHTETFELFTAQTSLDGKSGSWELFYPVEGVQTNVLDAEFTVTSDTEKEVTFTVPADLDNEHAGDTVHYARSGDQKTFHWTQIDEQTDTTVEFIVTWNVQTKEGSVTKTDAGGTIIECWGAGFQTVECTN